MLGGLPTPTCTHTHNSSHVPLPATSLYTASPTISHTLNLSLFSLSSSGVVNVKIENGILQWELPSELSEQVSAYHVLVYREGHRMKFPPMWVTRRVYNLSNLHLAAGTYYIEVSIIIGSSHWRGHMEKQEMEMKRKLEMETGNGNWKRKLETETGN